MYIKINLGNKRKQKKRINSKIIWRALISNILIFCYEIKKEIIVEFWFLFQYRK